MNSSFGRSYFGALYIATILAALLIVPIASHAQVDNTKTGVYALWWNTTGSYNTADGYNALYQNSSGNDNSALGCGALSSNTTGSYNTADGSYSLCYNTTAGYNAALGYCALYSNTTGSSNTASGSVALYFNTIGAYNTATGCEALYNNNAGSYNTADGTYALFNNTTAAYDIAVGYEALYCNTTGSYNTAVGNLALALNTTGTYNTANGYRALYTNTGSYNTATGSGALYKNSDGEYNTACGYDALTDNVTGSNNVAEGLSALSLNTTGSYNVAVGSYSGAKITGSSNITIGYLAGGNLTNGSNNVDIGSPGTAADSGVIRIGAEGTQKQTFIAGIDGASTIGSVPVYINRYGQLGTVTSSARFKYDIQNIGPKSDKLMDLRPVTFRYKVGAEDGTHPVQYGLIAEEVAKIYPDLVQYDKQGKPFTVYYHLLTPMMLDQLQKAHHQLMAQQTEFGAFKTAMQNQNYAIQTQMNSVQHTNQLLVGGAGMMILVGLAGAAVFAMYRLRARPTLRARRTETYAC